MAGAGRGQGGPQRPGCRTAGARWEAARSGALPPQRQRSGDLREPPCPPAATTSRSLLTHTGLIRHGASRSPQEILSPLGQPFPKGLVSKQPDGINQSRPNNASFHRLVVDWTSDEAKMVENLFMLLQETAALTGSCWDTLLRAVLSVTTLSDKWQDWGERGNGST
ncbi:uncharacterized protein M6G45_011813 [Spheniscus humboldti]